ncbi:MAG TPA: glutamate-1-semialdehyde 2,1-aminomutase [Methanomassiliicoccales archaeon]|nr:glutamate-1-semialdehyde 2,1-aminomutase [Methanomassiliicoccales archaeon]
MTSRISRELFEEARLLLPGGVSSPVRAFAPYPRYMARAKGAHMTDVDGNEYIDYCMGFGPLILGHARAEVVEAIKAQSQQGVLYGAPIEKEVEMARLISRYYPSMEMMRFVSSGTEATMHALRVARGYTGKKKIIKVEGAFHGAHDALLVKAGSGATTHSTPDSLGIPGEVTSNTLLVPFNDLDAMSRLIKAESDQVAALILEPVIGNAGPILPDEDYLRGLRELTEENSILLIFDEVITGFRLAMGGAQEYYGIRPDITTLGKIVGGGLPIGVFGASREIMSMVSPVGKVYQAGTFSGNPLSLAAGMKTIEILERKGHDDLNSQGKRMRRGLEQILQDMRLDYRVQGIGSMFQLFFCNAEVRDYAGAKECDSALFMRLFRELLEAGVYLPPSQWETNFLSTAHDKTVVDHSLDAFASALPRVVRS